VEYWIIDDHTSVYCDGDAGVDVPNHTMVVVEKCISIMIESMHLSDNEAAQRMACVLDDYVEQQDGCYDLPMMGEIVCNELDHLCSQGLICDHVGLRDLIEDAGVPEWILDIALNCRNAHDERRLAMEHWGWIRIVHANFNNGRNVVNMHELTKDNLSRVASHFYRECGDDAIKDSDIEWHDGWAGDIPFRAIEKGWINKIENNKRKVS
jgi:hypothetical protein